MFSTRAGFFSNRQQMKSREFTHVWILIEKGQSNAIYIYFEEDTLDSHPLSFLYFLHSLKTVCVSSSSPFPSCVPPQSAVLTTPLLTQTQLGH